MVNFSELISQQLGNGGALGMLINIAILMIFITFYGRIALQQAMFKLERSANFLEELSFRAEKIVVKRIKRKPDKKLREAIRNFLDFFVIPPVDIDPYGVMKKIEHIVDLEKYRFKYFVGQVAEDAGEEERANIMMGLAGAMNLYQLKKLLRHVVETVKKTKNIQIALIVQMQLPMIERIAKALLRGTEALSNGWPVGDGIGPYVVINMMENSKAVEVDDETVVSRRRIKNRDVIIIKAKGPGGRTGNPGKALQKIARKEKIAKIITIDASAKLEGEKTGGIAEGVGVALGGVGVERYQIENIATKEQLPLDSVIIKMHAEEAIMPMRKSVLEATPKVIDLVEKSVQRTKEKGKIVVIGVGNTCGVGNSKRDVEKVEKLIRANIKRMKLRAEQRKKGFRFKLPDFGF